MKATPISKLSAEWLPLVDKALEAQQHAYAPYSKFLVGSAIQDEHGVVHGGCNVENASYSGAICAERTAVVKMVSTGARRVTRVVVVTSSSEPCYPCGFCLQVLREFGPDAEVVAIDRGATVFQKTTMKVLLPHSFGPEQLPSAR